MCLPEAHQVPAWWKPPLVPLGGLQLWEARKLQKPTLV